MAAPKAAWGIDVGQCALKAIKLRAAADGKFEVLAQDFIEHPKILSQPDADRPALVAAALEKFLSRNDISNDKVAVSVPGQHTLARFSKLPPVEPKKVPAIVQFEAGQQIPFDLDEVIWDYQIFSEEDVPDIEVGIFAMKRDLIRSYLLYFGNVGIEPVIVQSAPLALYNALVYDGLVGDETAVLLDIGAENTDLIVATKHSLWTRPIPVGGNNFTAALVKAFKLSFNKAENLKRTAASSKYARQVFQAMRPVFADLVAEVQRSIGFYTSTHRDAELSKVISMGNAFKLAGLQKYLKQNLGMDIVKPESFNKLILPPGSETPADQFMSFGMAYGLAIQALGAGVLASNLLPPEIARSVVWRKKRPFFAASAACLLLSAGVICGRQVSDLRTLRANEGEMPATMSVEAAERILASGPDSALPPREFSRTWLEAAQALKNEWREYSDGGDAEAESIESILALREHNALWIRILDVIHRSLPVPQGELGQAETSEAYLTAVRKNGDQVPRSARPEIFIQEIRSRFEPDVYSIEFRSDDTSEKYGYIKPADDDAKPGCIITLICRTPSEKQQAFVTNTLIDSLRKLGREPGLGFYVNRVILMSGSTLERGGATGTKKDRRGGKSSGEDMQDALTGENISTDWECRILMDVVLGEIKPPEADSEDDEEGYGDDE